MGKVLRIFAIALLVPLAGIDAEEHIAMSKPRMLPYDGMGPMEKVPINEPSGMVYHPGRGTLFVVGDEGRVTEIGLDGRFVQSRELGKADLEGITCVPATGMLYVAVEGDDVVWEVAPETLHPLRSFTIPRTWRGKTVMEKGGAGIEAITFVPAERGKGGTFFIANQGPKRKSREDGPALAELLLPLEGKSGGEATMLRWIPMKVPDLSALAYDPRKDRLMLVSDTKNLLMRVTRDGRIEERYWLPGKDQEGITFDGDGNLYIARDSGGILKFVPR